MNGVAGKFLRDGDTACSPNDDEEGSIIQSIFNFSSGEFFCADKKKPFQMVDIFQVPTTCAAAGTCACRWLTAATASALMLLPVESFFVAAVNHLHAQVTGFFLSGQKKSSTGNRRN